MMLALLRFEIEKGCKADKKLAQNRIDDNQQDNLHMTLHYRLGRIFLCCNRYSQIR
jgi:hypothetical protein